MFVKPKYRVRLEVRDWSRKNLWSGSGHSSLCGSIWLWKKCWAEMHKREAQDISFFTMPLFYCLVPWQCCTSNLPISCQRLIDLEKGLLSIASHHLSVWYYWPEMMTRAGPKGVYFNFSDPPNFTVFALGERVQMWGLLIIWPVKERKHHTERRNTFMFLLTLRGLSARSPAKC